jgi:nicotinamidase-related amidase
MQSCHFFAGVKSDHLLVKEKKMSDPLTLRGLVGLPSIPAALRESALIMIDCQNTYTKGIMKLEGVEAAMAQCQTLLKRARDAGAHVIHIQHDSGVGSPYDVSAEIGRIADMVAPIGDEAVITKNYPSSFEKTSLDAELKKRGVKNLVYAGFMTHMCINSTARAGFNHGYAGTVVANATATRRLPNPNGGEVSASDVHRAALAMVADLFAIVVPDGKAIMN